ncbi:glycosyltransferase family 1 protein [Microcoleus sp. S13_C5]|uniref:glycosyltransferase family 1 protein n=1 Tax=Microcoleus sp. S13_C5 TaxID=3055411 RepID=UPI002FD69F04
MTKVSNYPYINQIDRNSIRILHVVGAMDRGGIETWLMHILRHIDRDRFQMDFLVHTTKPCAYDDEIRASGSKIIPCLHISKLWTYAANFRRILKEYGPYDIVHSHVHHFSGYVLRLAKQLGVGICIAHSHNDTSAVEYRAAWYRRGYLTLTKRWISHYASLGLGCSNKAAANLFGLDWQSDPRWQILFYGINLNPLRDRIDPVPLRSELGIPSDAFVIGHVGRFVEQKNHVFLLEIAAEVAKHEPKMRLLLVGEGSLRPNIEQKVLQLGLSDHVIFAGVRPDVPQLMRGVMDVFLFPSLHEGLGLVLIEAQAAGLPCIFSNVVPEEADVIKPLVQRISLSQPVSEWVRVVLQQREMRSTITQSDALAQVETSPFNIETSVKQLESIYQSQFTREDIVV